jgi:hypothetical protein
MNTGCALILLAEFLDEPPVYKVLEFFIGTQTKHFFATANGVANFQILEDAFEQVVETEDLVFRKDDAKFIGNMIGKSA